MQRFMLKSKIHRATLTGTDLDYEGRVLVRYSGTEPLCRVMVEGKSQAEIERHAQKIADVIAEELN